MAVERQGPKTLLTVVAASPAGVAREVAAGEGWSRLMARAQDGDREAYRLLLESITPYIRRLAGRCFKAPSDIDDAVQDVLLTLHMVRHAYDPKRPFGPWLVAIANRRIIDRLRWETRRKTREIALTADHETFAEPVTNLGAETFDEGVLGRAIDRLSPDQRQTITMLKLKEMSLKEAAAASGRSVVALKVATHRALKSLRRMLKQQSEQP